MNVNRITHRIGELLPGSSDLDRVVTQRRGVAVKREEPLDCHPAADLVRELILRALETNGLDFVGKKEKVQLASLLLRSVVGDDA